jgi:hypothetical protein
MYNAEVDPAQIRPYLEGLGLSRHRTPALLYAGEGATQWRIRPAPVDWGRGVPTCLMALSYLWNWLEPDTDAVGVWLPAYGSAMVVDATMRCHVIGLGATAQPVRESDRVQIARELRALIGSALGRPGRYSRYEPVLITADPAGVTTLLRTHLGDMMLPVVTPHDAAGVWADAAKVFIHHDALAEVVAAQPGPRADITILAPERTAEVAFAAAALCTDEVLAWPAAASGLAGILSRHREMQRLTR